MLFSLSTTAQGWRRVDFSRDFMTRIFKDPNRSKPLKSLQQTHKCELEKSSRKVRNEIRTVLTEKLCKVDSVGEVCWFLYFLIFFNFLFAYVRIAHSQSGYMTDDMWTFPKLKIYIKKLRRKRKFSSSKTNRKWHPLQRSVPRSYHIAHMRAVFHSFWRCSSSSSMSRRHETTSSAKIIIKLKMKTNFLPRQSWKLLRKSQNQKCETFPLNSYEDEDEVYIRF